MQVDLYRQGVVPSAQHNSPQQSAFTASNATTGSLIFFLPIVVMCAIVAYQKHRIAAMRRRIQRLNRLWQLESSEKLS